MSVFEYLHIPIEVIRYYYEMFLSAVSFVFCFKDKNRTKFTHQVISCALSIRKCRNHQRSPTNSGGRIHRA